MNRPDATPPPVTVAAVDLGSNSFHMLVAEIRNSSFRVIDKLREPVRLAAGLDASGRIHPEAEERALQCLARFGQRLQNLDDAQVRAVGTNTLRQAANAGDFADAAETALGHPIEIISGAEEARLIYAGVVHGLSPSRPRRLVADIGGGSTEIICGHLTEPRIMESLSLGCVTMTEHFFPRGRITEKRWRSALLHAELQVEPYAEAFQQQAWQQALGASGTIRAIQKVIAAEGWSEYSITRGALRRLAGALCDVKNIERLKLKGLSERRRPVFPGGVAILSALFEVLDIERMQVSDAALREGLLLDFLERGSRRDIRTRSVRALAMRFGVDLAQAVRVSETARRILEGLPHDATTRADGMGQYVEWAALLHEVGLTISHAGHHKHGAYVVENADLMGFSNAEQALLAALIRAQRGRFPVQDLLSMPPRLARRAVDLAVALRLSVLLNRGRRPDPLPELSLERRGKTFSLHLPAQWLESHPLTVADLEGEREALAEGGLKLRVL